jgi:hypothetical protein
MIEQNAPCYVWGETLFPRAAEPVMSIDEAQALVRHVWFFYRPGTIAPMVKPSRKDKYATGYRYAIHLPMWARIKPIVLHEVAHSLSFDDTGQLIDPAYSGHGPLYMRLLIDLYAMFMGGSRTEMLDVAGKLGVLVDRD